MPTHNIYAFSILFELWWENDEIKQIEAGHWSIFFKKPDVGDTKNRGKVNLQMASIHALRFLNEFFLFRHEVGLKEQHVWWIAP